MHIVLKLLVQSGTKSPPLTIVYYHMSLWVRRLHHHALRAPPTLPPHPADFVALDVLARQDHERPPDLRHTAQHPVPPLERCHSG